MACALLLTYDFPSENRREQIRTFHILTRCTQFDERPTKNKKWNYIKGLLK
jgi:hypothetical protein